MRIISITLRNFRNIEHMFFEPTRGVNVIYGDNAQGKTNLMEAMWLFTGSKSFRGAKESEFIKFGENQTSMRICFESEGREQEAAITYYSDERKKEITINGARREADELAGKFCGVVFAPSHLEIVSEGPAERRRFIDTAIGQIKPKYLVTLSEYNKTLLQRNSLLKDITYHSELRETLDVWNAQLAALGAALLIMRRKYIEKLNGNAKLVYSSITNDTETLDLEYIPSCEMQAEDGRQELYERLYKKLNETLSEDLKMGYTTTGPHRDELDIRVDNISVKSFGSQGQRRSAVLSLKLAEADILQEVYDEEPFVILDDVMSELDEKRQEYVLNRVKNKQVFLTCCDSSAFRRLDGGEIFELQNGKLAEE